MKDFQLPEWLSIGTIGTVLTAIISIIFVFIKFSNSIKSNKLTGDAQLNLLDTMVSKLTDMKDVVNLLKDVELKVQEQTDKSKFFMTNIDKNVESLALFLSDCFQHMDISAESKVKIRVKLDELFLAGKQEIIENLIETNSETLTNLNDAGATINKLESELQQAKERIPTKVPKKRSRV